MNFSYRIYTDHLLDTAFLFDSFYWLWKAHITNRCEVDIYYIFQSSFQEKWADTDIWDGLDEAS